MILRRTFFLVKKGHQFNFLTSVLSNLKLSRTYLVEHSHFWFLDFCFIIQNTDGATIGTDNRNWIFQFSVYRQFSSAHSNGNNINQVPRKATYDFYKLLLNLIANTHQWVAWTPIYLSSRNCYCKLYHLRPSVGLIGSRL